MMPAIFTDEKVVVGSHHGDAFSKLSEEEKNGQLISGFVDLQHYKFISDYGIIYLKEIILLRHAQSDIRQENGPITCSGRYQAFHLAKFLSTLHLENFFGFCSPYFRCKQTSEIVKEVCSVPFEINYLLSKNSNNIIEVLDNIPEKSILITHTDCIQNILMLTHLIKGKPSITNCSITYINRNRLIWLAKEIK